MPDEPIFRTGRVFVANPGGGYTERWNAAVVLPGRTYRRAAATRVDAEQSLEALRGTLVGHPGPVVALLEAWERA